MSMNRGGTFVGTIWADTRIEGQAQTQQQLQGLNKSAKEAQGGFADLTKAVYGLALQYGLAREALGAWTEMLSEHRAILGAQAMMKSLGVYTEATGEQLKRVSSQWENFGIKNEQTIESFTQFLSVTNDTRKALILMDDAAKLALVTHRDIGTTTDALSQAWGGQDMMLRKLLTRWDAGAKTAKGFHAELAIAERVGRTYAEQMDKATLAQLAFNKAYKDLKVGLAEGAAPAVTKGFDFMGDRVKLFGIVLDETEPKLRRFTALLATANPVFHHFFAGVGKQAPDYSWAFDPKTMRWGPGMGAVDMGGNPSPPDKDKEKPETIDYYWMHGGEGTTRGQRGEHDLTMAPYMEALKEYQDQIKLTQDAWDKAHAEMFDVAQKFSDGVGQSFEILVTGGKDAFAQLARYWESMLLQMASKWLASEVFQWLGGAIRGGTFGGGARPVIPGDTTTYKGQGFGGYTPRPFPTMPGGGGNVVVNISPMDLAAAFAGSPVRIKRSLSTAMLSHGLETAASLT